MLKNDYYCFKLCTLKSTIAEGLAIVLFSA